MALSLPKTLRNCISRLGALVLTWWGNQLSGPCKVANINVKSIGHLCADSLGLFYAFPNERVIFYYRKSDIANSTILKYLPSRIKAVRYPKWLPFAWSFLESPPILQTNHYTGVHLGAQLPRIYAYSKEAKYRAVISSADKRRLNIFLDMAEVSREFCVVHIRSSNYDQLRGLSVEDRSFRNSDSDNVSYVINFLLENTNFHVVLLYDVGLDIENINTSHERILLYATSPMRTPSLDILVCATAKFFVGNASGMLRVPQLFGTPTFNIDIAPLQTVGTYSESDFCIPKIVDLFCEQKVTTFREQLALERRLAAPDLSKVVYQKVSPDLLGQCLTYFINCILCSDEKKWTKEDQTLIERQFFRIFGTSDMAFDCVGRIPPPFLRFYRARL